MTVHAQPPATEAPAAPSVRADGVLNPQYPASYWLVGFVGDVGPGEAVPMHRLERDVVLWRDLDGTLHCQDHACHEPLGRIGERWMRVSDRREGDTVACVAHRHRFGGVRRYRVVEKFDGIYVWNGPLPADHDLPDLLGAKGLAEEDVRYLTWRCLLPFPGKWFSENLPDAAHFAVLHNTGESADCEVTDDHDHLYRCTVAITGERKLSLSAQELLTLYREDRLGDIVEFAGDLDVTIYGGGFNVFAMGAPKDHMPTTGIAGAIRTFVESTPVINCLTPVTADSHLLMTIMPMPRVRTPIVGRALEAAMDRAAVARNWAVVQADIAVMTHRQEAPQPRYNRLDRALVSYRRFWDRRLLDRSLGEGDNKHSNGRRAGVAWAEDTIETGRAS